MMWGDAVDFWSRHWLLETILLAPPLCGIAGLFAYLWSRSELGGFLGYLLKDQFPTAGPVIVAHLAEISGKNRKKKRKGVNVKLRFLIDLFLPPDRAEETLMGLEDVYLRRWRPRYGRGLATFICSCHVAATIVTFHWGKIRKLKTLFGWPS
jgi:hypothetical protein